MIEQSSRTIAGIFAVLLLLATPVMTAYHPVFAATTPTGVIIPLYSYPGSYWTQVIQAKNAYPSVPIIAVINPDNGPSSSSDPNYVSGIQQLQAAGVIVLGYVDTSFASVSTSSAESQIKSYNSWYHVNGIFFDDMQNVAGDQTYYSTLSTYAKSLGMTLTVGNPGTSTLSSYIGTDDNLCIFENNYEPTVADLQSNTMGDPKSDFSFIAYEVGLPSQSFINSITPYVSYMYATNDGSDGNPYDSVPSYLGSLVAELASANGVTTSTVPGSPTGLTATATSSQVNLGWTAPSNNGGSAITGYEIDRSTNSGSTWSVIVSNTGSTSTTYSDTGLSSGTTYTYRVSAINSVGTSSPSNTASATISSNATVPQPPTGLTASSTSSSQINLGWTAPSNNGGSAISGYEVDSSTNNGSTWSTLVANTGSTSTTYSNTGLTANATYTYRVSAINSVGTSLPSGMSSATTLASSASPPPPTTVSLTVNSVDMSGNSFSGMWVELYASNGTTLATGYTPITFNVASGVQYTVDAANYQSTIFNHWNNGSTNSSITVTPTQNTTLTASYSTSSSVTLTVKSVNLSGNTFSGMWTVIKSGGSTVASGYTTFHYTAQSGTTYKVTVSNYQNYVFSHWSNGSTNPTITVTPTQSTTLVAYYNT